MKKGFKHEWKWHRYCTDDMRKHLDAVRPSRGYPDLCNPNGRPTKEAEVRAYRQEFPDDTRYRCAQELGIDYKTVCKWWDSCLED